MNSNNFLLGVSSVKKNNSKNHLNEEKINAMNKKNNLNIGKNQKNNKINKINKNNGNANLHPLNLQQNLNKSNVKSTTFEEPNGVFRKPPISGEPMYAEVIPKYSVSLINHIKNIENEVKNNDVINNIKMKNVVSKIIIKLEGNINSLTNKINKFNNEKKELQNISQKEQENLKNIIRKMYILIITIYKSLILNKEEKTKLLEKLRNTVESNTQFLNNIDEIVKGNNKKVNMYNNLVKENNITI